MDFRGLFVELDKALTMYQEAGLEEFEESDINNTVYYIDTEIDKLFELYEKLKTNSVDLVLNDQRRAFS